MTKVTPESIAYAAVLVSLAVYAVVTDLRADRLIQARFSICGQDSWEPQDGMFSLPDFYQAMVDLFDNPTDPWYIDTLAWWNKYVVSLFVTVQQEIIDTFVSDKYLATTVRQATPRRET